MAGREHALLAPRATIALVALLRALELPPGSEVLIPVNLCANPAYAVRWAGLRPLFADVSPAGFNMDLEAAERMAGQDTRVLLVAPLFGHPLDVPALIEFARRHDLIIVEDAAQATGLRYGERPAGSLGLCSVYSFGPGKIAAAGGGAALLSDDPDLLERARLVLDHMPSGRLRAEDRPGRILQALRSLPAELEARGALAGRYRNMLDSPGITHPTVPPGAPLWKYSILLPSRAERDRATRDLLASAVEATNLYPPLASLFTEARAAETGAFPVAANLYNRIVNLPLWPQFPGLEESVARVFERASSEPDNT
jgi:dTDP-4-amino-4,6-dideoxygalactose transaminase